MTNSIKHPHWLYALFIAVAIFSFVSCSTKRPTFSSCPQVYKPQREVLKTITDERGLTSVIFRENGQEYGLDYLTKQEFDNYFNARK